MSPERAQEIWDARSPFGEFNLSPDEVAYVRGIWVRMPGHTCFAEALLRIAKGQAEGVLPMIGTAVFYDRCSDDIVVQTAVYRGETPASYSVQARAQRTIEMLGMPATDPVQGCNAKLLKFSSARVKFYPLGH